MKRMGFERSDIIGLFPAFGSDTFGGVQTSGREAWEGIVRSSGESKSKAIFYESGASKFGAILDALRNRQAANIVLVWHVQLLKLLPFLNHSAARVVLFLHGIEAWMKQDLLTRRCLAKADAILSNSDHTWAQFLKSNHEFSKKLHRTVHLGSGSALNTSTPSPSEQPAVLMVGRLNSKEDYKGHRQMIEAWPLVLRHAPQAELWIAGDGDLRPALEGLAQTCSVRSQVRFFGHVTEGEKEELIARSRCLALPSRGEGFGIVYLEAMRMGRPCIVSTLDAGREVVNPPEAGLAINPDDPAQVAQAVGRMLTPGLEWNLWSSRARSRYEARFTTEHFQQRLLGALFEA